MSPLLAIHSSSKSFGGLEVWESMIFRRVYRYIAYMYRYKAFTSSKNEIHVFVSIQGVGYRYWYRYLGYQVSIHCFTVAKLWFLGKMYRYIWECIDTILNVSIHEPMYRYMCWKSVLGIDTIFIVSIQWPKCIDTSWFVSIHWPILALFTPSPDLLTNTPKLGIGRDSCTKNHHKLDQTLYNTCGFHFGTNKHWIKAHC